MAANAADRNLLFGLLALQNGLISQTQLLAAFQAWTLERSRSLADHLAACGDLDDEDRVAVEALAARHVKKHGGDLAQSLAEINAGRSTRESLARLADGDIEVSLAHLGSQSAEAGQDVDRTATHSVGTATSDGQRFRIVRPHARGGLGDVFVALDDELHREVALKQIIEKHADDPVSRQRFVAEAEITGALEHPGVVPVYGLGTYGGGRPYYAMRFIKGDSLKKAIEQFHGDDTLKNSPGRRSLELRKLLRRFLDVCNAVGYAHSRGVIHRDLKPSNIILGQHGETLVVDWGLAKAIGRADPTVGEQTIAPSSSGSSETLPGSALGTPAYMSPEQAGGELDRLGLRSDVYSLGATLYCLLTGKPPLEGEDVGEILRKVQAGEFRAPRAVNPALDKALEAVCTKAMATAPRDRYASSRALAEDVERWAADEAVTAYPEPWTRTLVRWLTRHRTGVTTVAAAVLVGVVGLSAVLAVQTRANAQLSASLNRETTANRALAASNDQLTRAKEAVQARYDLSVAAIKTFHTGVSEDFLLKEEKFKDLRNRLLRSAQDFYGKLSALLGRETDAASLRALLASNFEMAELTGKVGRTEDALEAHRAVLAAREALAAEPGSGAVATVDVGSSLIEVAGLLKGMGKTDEALAMYRRAESLLADLARAEPSARQRLAVCRSSMGWALYEAGKSIEALAAYKLARADLETVAAAPEASDDARNDLADTVNRIGVLLFSEGRPAEAEPEFRAALAIHQKLAAAEPAHTRFRFSLAHSYNDLGILLSNTGKLAEAEVEYLRAIAIQQKLADDNPAVTDFQFRLAFDHASLGNLLWNMARPAEAESEYRTALALFKKLAEDLPAVTEFRNYLAAMHNSVGAVLSNTGKPAEAESELRTALALVQKLADDHPAVAEFSHRLAISHNALGRLLAREKRFPEAFTALETSLAVRQKLVDADPKNTMSTKYLGESYADRGWARVLAGQRALAAADLRRALELWATVPEQDAATRKERARALALLAGLGQDPKSGVTAAEAVAFADHAVAALRDAINAGWARRDELKEPDFDPLRSREDFKKLMKALEAKPGPNAKPAN
jgi:serine/threonine-protein kinase